MNLVPHILRQTTSIDPVKFLTIFLPLFSGERVLRSRQHERGTSQERRYKRSHRRSPSSGRQHSHVHSHRDRDRDRDRDRAHVTHATSSRRARPHRHHASSSPSQERHRHRSPSHRSQVSFKSNEFPYFSFFSLFSLFVSSQSELRVTVIQFTPTMFLSSP